MGRRTYEYKKDFFSDRKAQVTTGGVRSEDIELGSRGTPQGFVLSLFLLNVAMIGLREILDRIEGLNHSLYTDDITLWVTGGIDGGIWDILQTAINAIETYVIPTGLACSPLKLEFLFYQRTMRGRKPSLRSL